MKEKKDGDIKARSCVNDNPQREHIAKEEAAAPTVVLESVSPHQLLTERKVEKW